ncbi:MAG: ABC transporter substrate-binding protein [Anaerolineae bacterium]
MNRSRNVNWRVMVFAAVILLITGSVFAVNAQSGAVLRIGIVTPATLDPALGSNDGEVLFNRSIYDHFIDILPDRTLAPNLASDWSISDDGLTYTFNLVQGVKFHDGSDFSSADVVFTFNRLKEVKSSALNLLGDFEVSAPDGNTVVFTLAAPNADFLYGVGSRFALILKDGTTDPVAANIGTGPFMNPQFADDGASVSLSKNANYWKAGEPALDGVEFKYIDDPVTQVNALRSGDVDFIYKISPDQVSVVESESGVSLIKATTNQHPVIRLRTDVGPGQDVKVRQAFKYATDREQLNELVLEGRGTVGNNDPIGPAYGDYFDSSIQNQTYDPQKACELLSEAGYADGLTITLQTINVLGYDQLATVLQQQWEPACIKAEIQVNEEGFYYADDNPNNWLKAELGITGWGDRPVPQGYLVEAYATDGIYNETHWSDPALDDLIKQASATSVPAERVKIYNQISEIFNESGPVIIPWFAPVFAATRVGVNGLVLAPFPGDTDLRTVSLSS